MCVCSGIDTYMYFILAFLILLSVGLDTPSQDRSILFSPCPEESDRDLSDANREIGM